MGRKASGQDKVERILRRQANGEIYVYERISRYNREKGYYVSVGSKLLGKLKPGSNDRYDLEPTRPKRRAFEEERSAPAASQVEAERRHVGMISIVKRISEIAGIEKELKEVLPDEEVLPADVLFPAFSLSPNIRGIPSVPFI